MEDHVTSVTHVIQLAVAPVFLLTAIATLISALNTRLGRIVDRIRVLQAQGPAAARSEAAATREHEFAVLSRRVHLSYLAILSAGIAGLFICLVVAMAFIGVLSTQLLDSTFIRRGAGSYQSRATPEVV